MANASLKWNSHISNILQQIEDQNDEVDQKDDEDGNGKIDEQVGEEEEAN